jgi:iron(III) transport system permease protein
VQDYPSSLVLGRPARRFAWPRWSNILFPGLVGLVAYLVAVPLGLLILGGFIRGAPGTFAPLTLTNYIRAYGSPALLELFYNSFVFAAGSVLLALPVAVLFAWLIERTNTPLRTLAYALVIAPVAMPGMLLSMSWVLLLSPNVGIINRAAMFVFGLDNAPFNIYSLGGMIFTEGLRLVPTSFLLLVGAFRAMDPSLEEAALVSGATRWVTTLRVTLRIMAPAILTAAIYIFMTAIESFEIPGVLGLRNGILVFSSKIYYATTSTYGGGANYGEASALSSTYLVISIFLIYFYQRSTRHSERFATVTGKGYRPRLMDLGIWKYFALAFFLGYFCLAVLLPILIMFWASLIPFYQAPSREALTVVSWASYSDLWNDPEVGKAVYNTASLMLSASVITTLLAASVAWVVLRSKFIGRRVLDTLTFLPHAVPSVVLALALIYVYLTLDFIPIYGTSAIILVGFVTNYLPFSTRTLSASIIQIHKELEEAGRVSGASSVTVFGRIVVPLLLPTMAGVAIWVAVHAMRELSMALMLNSTSNNVISFLIWSHWEGGDLRHASALGVALILIMLAMTFGGRYFATRHMKAR